MYVCILQVLPFSQVRTYHLVYSRHYIPLLQRGISATYYCGHVTCIPPGLKNRHGNRLCWMPTGRENVRCEDRPADRRGETITVLDTTINAAVTIKVSALAHAKGLPLLLLVTYRVIKRRIHIRGNSKCEATGQSVGWSDKNKTHARLGRVGIISLNQHPPCRGCRPYSE